MPVRLPFHDATRGRASDRWIAVAMLVCALAAGTPAWAAAAAPTTTTTTTAADWIGRTRAEVLQVLGKPQSSLHRGDTEVLLFPGGVRVEVREDLVVTFRDSNAASIVTRDGTRYAPTEQGRVRRADPEAGYVTIVPPPVVAALKPAVPATTATPVPAASKPEAADAAEDEIIPGVPHSAQVATGLAGGVLGGAEKLLSPTGPRPVPKDAPPWVAWAGLAINAAARFLVALVVLRLSLKWLDLPGYLPDLIAVAGMYTVAREVLYTAGGVGGMWEFIRLFKVADVASFLVLSVALFRFKVALTGITALKIAAITKVVSLGVMLAVGLVTAFGLMAFY